MTGVDVASVAARFDVAGPVDAVETNLTGHINESHIVVAGVDVAMGDRNVGGIGRIDAIGIFRVVRRVAGSGTRRGDRITR